MNSESPRQHKTAEKATGSRKTSGSKKAAPRTRARRGEGGALRDEILEAAERLVLEKGRFESVTIDDLAGAVGVTPPSLYRHFPDKQALVYAVSQRFLTRFRETVIEQRGGRSEDPVQRLFDAGLLWVEFALAYPDAYRVLFMSHPDDGIIDPSRTPAMFAPLLQSVTECLEAGYGLPSSDPFVVACVFWANAHGLASLLITRPDFDWPPVEQLVETSLLPAIRPPSE